MANGWEKGFLGAVLFLHTWRAANSYERSHDTIRAPEMALGWE